MSKVDKVVLFQEALEEALADISFFIELWHKTEDDWTAAQYGQDVVLERCKLHSLLEQNKGLLH